MTALLSSPADPILIVEDDPGTALLVKSRLAEAGWDAAVVASGQAAIAWLGCHATPLMLLDHNLPDMTGEELIQRQAADGTLPPFIVTTGAGSEQLAVALMKLGARDYLVKDSAFLQSLQPAVARVLKVVETERQLARAELALRESEDRYRRITEGLTDYQYRVRVEHGRAVATTHGQGCEAVTGYTVEEFAADADLWFTIVAPEDRDAVRAWVQRILQGRETEPLEHRIVRKDGALRWVRDTTIRDLDASGRLVSYDGVVQDITERKRSDAMLRAASLYSRNLIEASLDPMVTISAEGRITDVNGATESITGLGREQLVGTEFAGYFTDPDLARAGYMRAFTQGNVIDYPLAIRHSSGSSTEVLYNASIYCDEHGAVLGVLAVARDITERRSWEGQLMTLAHYDTLTQLPNRTLFLEAAEMGIAHAKRSGKLCAVVFVDLDAFKNVNDTLGHSVGDELLRDTAARLASCIRETDMLARLGGDEFVIFLTDLEGGGGAQYIAERVMEKFNTSRMIAHNDLFITVSMGIAVFPNDGDSLEELLKNADTAMYAAKDTGRNKYCFFDGTMNKRAITKMQIERGLRRALARQEFELHYQPIAAAGTGRIRGFEALLRWNKPGGELVEPDAFIPIAEETGLITPIGEWVLFEACRFNQQLVEAGQPDSVMSINVSVAQLRRKNLVEVIGAALERSGLRPELLELEVTESLCIESLEAAIEILNAIRALGVRICLDDFGTGYSSLMHLQKLPISTVKIDRQFIRLIENDGDENAMIPAIISLAHKLRLEVVAEGVQTRVQFERLVAYDCDYCQGYLLSRPLPAREVAPLLASVANAGWALDLS